MGIIIRQSFKATVASYFGIAVGAVATLFVYPYFLSPEIIGLSRVLLDAAIFFAFFAQAGLPFAIVKYFHHFNLNRYSFFWLSALLPLISFTLITLISLSFRETFVGLFSEKSPLFVRYFLYIFPFAFFYMYQNIYESYSATLYRIAVPKVVREVFIRVMMIVVVAVYAYFRLSVTEFIVMIVMAYAAAAVLNFSYVARISPEKFFRVKKITIPKSLLKEGSFYIMIMFFAGIGTNIVSRVDTFMITSMVGLESTGIYSISFFIAAVIEIPSRTTLQISAPFVSEAMTNRDYAKVGALYSRNTINQAVIGGLLLIMIWINVDALFALMPNGEIYAAGKYVVLFIGIAKLIDSVTGMNSTILIYSHYYRYYMVLVFLLAILTIAGNLLMIPLFGINGAAAASMASFFVANGVVILIIYNKFGIQPFNLKFLLLLAVYALSFFLHYIMPDIGNVYYDSVYRTLIIFTVYAAIVYLTGISPDVNAMAEKIPLAGKMLASVRSWIKKT